jgi:hypothetical protein
MNKLYPEERSRLFYSVLAFIISFIILMWLSAMNVFAEGIVNPNTAKWQANIESDLAGYKIHYGSTSEIYTETIDVGNVITYDMSGLSLSDGQYYVVLTAYDISGNESGFGNEVPFVWNREAPVNPMRLELF